MHRFESEKRPVEIDSGKGKVTRVPLVSEEIVTLPHIPRQRTESPEVLVSSVEEQERSLIDTQTHVERRAQLDISRRRLLNDLKKMKDLDDFHPSELSHTLNVSMQTIYEGLSTLRAREERRQNNRPLTLEEKQERWDKMLELRQQGFTDPEIADMTDLSYGTVVAEWNKMKKRGVDLPPRKTGRRPKEHAAGPLPIISPADRIEILKRDMSARERAEILGIQADSVRHYCRILRKQGIDIPKRSPGSNAEQRRVKRELP